MADALLLPPQTVPPDEVFVRRHAPAPIAKNYVVFRDCLRWEFGFTCAICLLHEQDIIGWCGAEGWGVMQIEHMVPQSHDLRTVGTYSNLLYICRLCNGARSDTDREDGSGGRLLDPTSDVWSEHFTVSDDRLVHAPADRNAAYTADVYVINDARKVRLRRARREHLQGLVSELACEHRELTRLAGALQRADAAKLTDLQAAVAALPEELAA